MVTRGNSGMSFYLYDDAVAEQLSSHTYQIEEKAKARSFDNAIIEPLRPIPNSEIKEFEGGVCTRNFEFIAGQRRAWDESHTIRSCESSYICPEESIVHMDEEVVFGGVLCNHFGHMLMDTSSRLWYVISHPECTARIAFVTIPSSPSFFVEGDMHYRFLEMLGIEASRVLLVWQPTEFTRVLVPDETVFLEGRGAYKKEALVTFNKLRDSALPSERKKIYLTRSKYNELNPSIGEEAFEEFFASRGYEVVSPELLSFDEQVSLFAHATHIAGTTGSVTHLACCAANDAECIFLNRSADPVPGHVMITSMRGIQAVYIDVHLNFLPEDHIHGVFLLGRTPCWDQFIKESPDLGQGDALPNNVDSAIPHYIETWGREIDTPLMYQYVLDEGLPQVAYRVNRFYLHKNVRQDSYMSATDNQTQQGSASVAMSDRMEELCAPQKYCLASLAAISHGCYRLTGSIDLPLVAQITSLQFLLQATDSDCSAIVAWQDEPTYTFAAQTLKWSLDLSLDSVPEYSDDALLRVCIVVGSGDFTHSFGVMAKNDLSNSSSLLYGGDAVLKRLEVDPATCLLGVRVQSVPSLVKESLSHRLESVEHSTSEITFRGALSFAYLEDAPSFWLAFMDSDANAILQYPLVYSPLSNDTTEASFTARVSTSELMRICQEHNVKKPNLQLMVLWRDTKTAVPFGVTHSDLSLAQLKQASYTSHSQLATFHQNKDNELSVRISTVDAILKRSINLKIHTFAWEGSGLRLTGAIRSTLLCVPNFVMSIDGVDNTNKKTCVHVPLALQMHWDKGYYASFDCLLPLDLLEAICQNDDGCGTYSLFISLSCGMHTRRLKLDKSLFSLSIWERTVHGLQSNTHTQQGISIAVRANKKDCLQIKTLKIPLKRRLKKRASQLIKRVKMPKPTQNSD